ncbi:MAG: selenocysteine-specific translation elongation factor, partial [Nocardioidaceae bacterium]|nr:selenocysteine-specific translation elongation factor [Nocardioidaceae bacterium]
DAVPVDGLPLRAAARLLGLPDLDLVRALVEPPLEVVDGYVRPGDGGLPDALAAAATAVLAEVDHPFGAPDARRLAQVGLDAVAVARLHRAGVLLRLADGVVVRPGSDDLALAVLRDLRQPFTVSEARQALGTSRRVALPLLGLLDATGRTVRLADDRRRTR